MNLQRTVFLADSEATRSWGEALAGNLRAGDLIVLVGDLGAGKTTLTRGLGEGLGVRGAVTSPTFVIARRHPAGERGIDLPYYFGTAISVRCVTEAADNGTTEPATTPIIELEGSDILSGA